MVVRTAIAREVQALLRHVPGASLVPAETTSAAASLSLGLRFLEPSADRAVDRAVFVTPVDLLPAGPGTLEALLAAAALEGVTVATPRCRGRGGHPVVVRESVLRVFERAYHGTLRELIQSQEEHRRRVDVDDTAVTGDFDTPAALTVLGHGVTFV